MALYKTFFFDFWFRPPNPQNLLPKIWHKIAYKSACTAYTPEMFGPTRGFSAIQCNHTNVVRPTLVAMATTFSLGAESNRLPVCRYHYLVKEPSSRHASNWLGYILLTCSVPPGEWIQTAMILDCCGLSIDWGEVSSWEIQLPVWTCWGRLSA